MRVILGRHIRLPDGCHGFIIYPYHPASLHFLAYPPHDSNPIGAAPASELTPIIPGDGWEWTPSPERLMLEMIGEEGESEYAKGV